MNGVNFLPDSFYQKRARRRRTWRQRALVLGVAGLLGLWSLSVFSGTSDLRQRAEQLESDAQAAQLHRTALVQLREQHAALDKQVAVRRELVQPIGYAQTLAVLTAMLPDSITLEKLSLTTVLQHEEGDAQPQNDHIALSMEGLALDDLTVASLVADLDDSPLFDNVKLRGSRGETVRGIAARRFRVDLTLNLEREFVPPPTGQEVADAS